MKHFAVLPHGGRYQAMMPAEPVQVARGLRFGVLMLLLMPLLITVLAMAWIGAACLAAGWMTAEMLARDSYPGSEE